MQELNFNVSIKKSNLKDEEYTVIVTVRSHKKLSGVKFQKVNKFYNTELIKTKKEVHDFVYKVLKTCKNDISKEDLQSCLK